MTNTSARNEREAARARILAKAAARRHINSASAPPLTAAQLATLTEAATNPSAYPTDWPDHATRYSMTLAAATLGRYLYASHLRDLAATGECHPFE
jgi:hypothetical protein